MLIAWDDSEYIVFVKTHVSVSNFTCLTWVLLAT
jgi:hypothetical protein